MNIQTSNQPQIKIYGTAWCPDCKRAKKFLGEQRIQYQNFDIEEDPQAMAFVEQANHGKHIIPTILFPDGSTLAEPSNAELAQKLGLQTQAAQDYYDVIIIGGGPAGLTAAFYMAREGLNTLVIEKAGLGGQVGITQTLDNFPGFDEGISGAEFADRLVRQAKKFGVEILQATEVAQICPEGQFFCITTSSGDEHIAKVVLLATGASYRRLNIPGENELIGVNIHFCATCDGAFYKNQNLLVVGGGNSAFEEALFLTRFTSRIDILTHSETPKASKILQEKVAGKPNMAVITSHNLLAFEGKNHLEAVSMENLATGVRERKHYDGVFLFVGLSPNSSLVKDLVDTNPAGFIQTAHNLMTSVPGLFAAGDVRQGATQQAASAAGEGATVALMIRDYLREIGYTM